MTSGKGKSVKTVKRSVDARGSWRKERGINRWNTGDFGGSETIQYEIVMMETWHYAFSNS